MPQVITGAAERRFVRTPPGVTHAVLFATGCGDTSADILPLTSERPATLLPIVDRPVIQCVIESLVRRGIRDFDVVLCERPEQIEELIGDGQRWGAEVRFHLVQQAKHPYDVLSYAQLPDRFLLGHADTVVPCIEAAQLRESTDGPVAFTFQDINDETTWSGWAIVESRDLGAIPRQTDRQALGAALTERADAVGSVRQCAPPLSVATFADLLESNRRVLSGEFPEFMAHRTSADTDIWLSRNTSLHPTAKLIAPVYIGANCRIGRGATVGPNVAIGDGCLIDSKCRVEDSVVLPHTSIGEGLEVVNVILDKRQLINVRIGAALSVPDEFLVGDLLEARVGHWLRRSVSRIAAVTLLAITWPLLLLVAVIAACRRQPMWHEQAVQRIQFGPRRSNITFSVGRIGDPSSDSPGGRRQYWKHLLQQVLPGLIAVACGKMSLVGITPRSQDEWDTMSNDLREVLQKTKPGLITESFVQFGHDATADEIGFADAYYAAGQRWTSDLKLIGQYGTRLLIGPRVSPGTKSTNGPFDSASV